MELLLQVIRYVILLNEIIIDVSDMESRKDMAWQKNSVMVVVRKYDSSFIGVWIYELRGN